MKYQTDIISVFVMVGSLIWHICNSTKGFPDPPFRYKTDYPYGCGCVSEASPRKPGKLCEWGQKLNQGKLGQSLVTAKTYTLFFLVILQQTTDNFILLRGTVGEVWQVWENLWN